ncbi:hypothetical protein [Janibacter melonis]|uniref:hypothetical protein n=1 Tax=Janibacter melonis TaxID=262209 RepID=UPI00209638E9|nr:hypothetical protein [Janibacter melonis]
MAADAPDALPTGPHRAGRDPLRLGLLAGSLLCLLLVGLAHPSVAAPPLGPAGWVPHLPDLPLGGWVVVALQVAGYALGAAALLRGLRVPSRLDIPWAAWALVGGLVLLTVPYGTADHTNYAAYGHILVEGGDPWVTTPQDFGPDRITSAVQPPWEDTPSVYGPVATGLMGLSALVGGELPRQVVWVWQVLVVAAWLIARALLLGLTGDRESVDTWWTGNVLVLGAGVLGAHVDLLATTALVGALLATRVRGCPVPSSRGRSPASRPRRRSPPASSWSSSPGSTSAEVWRSALLRTTRGRIPIPRRRGGVRDEGVRAVTKGRRGWSSRSSSPAWRSPCPSTCGPGPTSSGSCSPRATG